MEYKYDAGYKTYAKQFEARLKEFGYEHMIERLEGRIVFLNKKPPIYMFENLEDFLSIRKNKKGEAKI